MSLRSTDAEKVEFLQTANKLLQSQIADLKRQLRQALAQVEIVDRALGDPGNTSSKVALDAYVQEKVDRAVLEESEWWEHTVGLVHADHPEGFDPECMYCERMAANRAKVKPATPADPAKEK